MVKPGAADEGQPSLPVLLRWAKSLLLRASWRLRRTVRPPYSGAKPLALLALVAGPAFQSHNRSQFRRSGRGSGLPRGGDVCRLLRGCSRRRGRSHLMVHVMVVVMVGVMMVMMVVMMLRHGSGGGRWSGFLR